MTLVLVATDGSSDSLRAVEWAARLAVAHHSELVVMTAFVPEGSELPPDRVAELEAGRENELLAWSAPARTIAAEGGEPRTVRTVLRHGDVSTAVRDLGDELGADIVVIGRAGSSGGPGLLALGSTAEDLAHHVERPLAVVGGTVMSSIGRIVVGVDGSDNGRRALRWAADTARAADADVITVTTVPDMSDPGDEGYDAEVAIRDQVAAELEPTGCRYLMRFVVGSDPADGLVDEASRQQADMIVVGMRGLGQATGLRVGGVALAVLHRGNRPLVLVPPAHD